MLRAADMGTIAGDSKRDLLTLKKRPANRVCCAQPGTIAGDSVRAGYNGAETPRKSSLRRGGNDSVSETLHTLHT